MKTYLLDALNKIRRFDESLDIKTILCNKPWVAFDDEQQRRLYIFKEDGGLVITSQGKGRETNWEYLSANKTLKFKDADNVVELYHPIVFDNSLLVLNLDTTGEYAFLVNEDTVFKPTKLEDILFHIKEFDKTSGDSTVISKPTVTIPSKPLIESDDRPTISFAGDVFSPAQRDGKLFYVNQDKRYAFSSVEHIFDKAILVTDNDGDYLFYYNDTLENVMSSATKPEWIEYWDGLILDGIILNKDFLFYKGKWFKCVSISDGYYKIEEEDVIEYFQFDKKNLIKVPVSQIGKIRNNADNDGCFIIGMALFVALFVVIVVIVCAG